VPPFGLPKIKRFVGRRRHAVTSAFDEDGAGDRGHPHEIIDREHQFFARHAMDERTVFRWIQIGITRMAPFIMQIARRDSPDQLAKWRF
jgi:hypothetical protein